MPRPLEVALLSGAVSAQSSSWQLIGHCKKLSIDVSGISGDTVQVRGSNSATEPAATDDGRQVGSDITSDTIYAITDAVKWIKVKISTYSAGTISAQLFGRYTAYGM